MRSLTRVLAALVATVVLAACSGAPEPTPTSPAPTTPLPGEAYTWPYKTDSQKRVVIGRTLDDPLELYQLPTEQSEIVGEVFALDDRATATNRYQKVDKTIWIELAFEGRNGWTPLEYISQVGKPKNETKRFRKLPNDPDLAELGYSVGRKFVGTVPDLVVIDLRTGEDGYVIVDVLGSDDDAIEGYRIRVEPELGEAGYTADLVLIAPFCSRGVINGVCV